jgi:hypothetical protein
VGNEAHISEGEKVKVKLSLGLINCAPRHKDAWGSGGIAPPFLTFTPDGNYCSASRPARFNPRDTAPDTHCIGSWVGPKAGLGIME